MMAYPPDVIDKSSLLFDLVTVRLSPQVSAVISIEISISFIRKVTSLNGRFVAVMLTLPSHPVVFAALSPSLPSRPSFGRPTRRRHDVSNFNQSPTGTANSRAN